MAAKRNRARSPYLPAPGATGRQEEYLAAIRELTASSGHGPTTGEIAAHMGISRQGALKELQRLARAGRLTPPTGWALR